jgi:hypothetical protein
MYSHFGLHTDVARNSPSDIRKVLASYERKDVGKEFLERSKDYQRYFTFLSFNFCWICEILWWESWDTNVRSKLSTWNDILFERYFELLKWWYRRMQEQRQQGRIWHRWGSGLVYNTVNEFLVDKEMKVKIAIGDIESTFH